MNELRIEHIDYRLILVDNYKSLGLSEYDLCVLLSIDNILKQEKVLITADLLALKMNLSIKDIDALLVSLTSRGFLDYESEDGKVITSLKPTYNKIIVSFQNELVRIVQGNKNKEVKEELSNIYLIMQNELGRNLSPLEIEKVREWISQDIKEEVIVSCIHECQHKSKRVTVNQIDKTIAKYLSSRDIEKEGYSSVNEKWKKDIENTIRIVKGKWED
jgi:DNA replication protein